MDHEHRLRECPICGQDYSPATRHDCPGPPKAEERLDERVEQLGAPRPRLRDNDPDDLPPAA